VRSYGQYCALARALDVVGSRWSALVVRELLEGPRRFGELLDGLPGIATNLLADRLRQLQADGVVERRPDGRYQLTRWGAGLRQPLYALARWAAPVVMTRPAAGDSFRAHWLAHPVSVLFEGVDRRRQDMSVELVVGDAEALTLECRAGVVRLLPGRCPAPDLVLSGPPDALLGLVSGYLDPADAEALGVAVAGDPRRLRHLRPRAPAPSEPKLGRDGHPGEAGGQASAQPVKEGEPFP
jgi:DNA-binding HxlR family transcriptional regulator